MYHHPARLSTSEVRIKVLAAGVYNLVRSRAAGKHYSTVGKEPPHIPGTDGVGRNIEKGELVYFNALKAPIGSFAEEINVDMHEVYPLPDQADPETVAAMVNPAMSSWMALTARADV